MRKLWLSISYLGIEGDKDSLSQRALILTNQLNFVMLVLMFIVLIFLSVMRSIENTSVGIGSLRVLWVLILNIVNLTLAYFKKNQVSKLLFLLLPPVLIFILPTLIGFVEEESYAYYPLTIIIMSALPQVLLVQKEEKKRLIFVLIFYILLLIFIEPFLFYFSPSTFKIIPIFKNFLIYSKVVQIVCFIFLQFELLYLRRINWQFEQKVVEKNNTLDKQNVELNNTLQNLNQIQQQLYQAEKMTALGTLTAGVAHEINNPLNFISGGVHMLKDEMNNFSEQYPSRNSPDFEPAIKLIDKGVDKASKIINALLSITGSGDATKEMTDVNDLINNTLIFIKYRIPERIKILKDFQLSCQIPLIGAGFQQVVLSIIDNALSAIELKPWSKEEYIKLKTYLDKNAAGEDIALIEISNSGPPIPDKLLKSIFEPFFTTKDVGKGTGLGLTIAYMFIKDHNGTLIAENTFDGVCFKITLPAQE